MPTRSLPLKQSVSILVSMDVDWEDHQRAEKRGDNPVSILVSMDVDWEVPIDYVFNCVIISFNPCFNGC